jgi:hypothetical protein
MLGEMLDVKTWEPYALGWLDYWLDNPGYHAHIRSQFGLACHYATLGDVRLLSTIPSSL